MYLHLGQGVMVRDRDMIGIFDLDNTTWSFRTRRFLERAEREGRDGGPVVYLTPLSPAALAARAGRNGFE